MKVFWFWCLEQRKLISILKERLLFLPKYREKEVSNRIQRKNSYDISSRWPYKRVGLTMLLYFMILLLMKFEH